MDSHEEAVRHLLMKAPGEPLCDWCLALACETTLAEMHEITKALLTESTFRPGATCSSCLRTVPTITCLTKCAHCSRPVDVTNGGIVLAGDLLHETCLQRLITDDTIRISSKMTMRSRELIEQSRRRMREGHGWPPLDPCA